MRLAAFFDDAARVDCLVMTGPDITDPRIRFLIISDGRSGTTLLSSILGHAGADFGLPVASEWSPSSGGNEHPELVPATRILEKAEHIWWRSERVSGRRALGRFYRSLAKSRVRRLLDKAPFHKSSAYMPPFAHKLGYIPRIIASYRDFGDIARSKLLLQRMTYPAIADRLEMTYRNALIAIHTYGGCAISFEEIADPAETGWVDALSETTGIARDALKDARGKLVKNRRGNDPEKFRLDPRLESLFADLQALKGRYIPPSRQYLRSL
jgi:hypothetical protein